MRKSPCAAGWRSKRELARERYDITSAPPRVRDSTGSCCAKSPTVQVCFTDLSCFSDINGILYGIHFPDRADEGIRRCRSTSSNAAAAAAHSKTFFLPLRIGGHCPGCHGTEVERACRLSVLPARGRWEISRSSSSAILWNMRKARLQHCHCASV